MIASNIPTLIFNTVENNQNTENYQKMLVWLSKHLQGASSVHSFGLSNYVYIQRICMGILLQEGRAEEILEMKHGTHGNEQSSLVDQLTNAILQAILVLVDKPRPSLYHSLLLLELMKFIIVVCTSGNGYMSEVFLESFMKSDSMHFCARALLNFWIVQDGYNVPKSSIFDDIGSESHYAIVAMAKVVLSFPWQATALLRSSSPVKESPLILDDDPFATVSCLVILIFYFHGSREHPNVFRTSMDALESDDALSDGKHDPSNVDTSISFPKLAVALGKRMISSETTSLLLYLLLQGNKNVLDYFMVCDQIVFPSVLKFIYF